MTTSIGIISDIHANPKPLQEALEIFARADVSEIICAGDIVGYFDQVKACIDLLVSHHCKTIIGNHDQSYLQDNPDQIYSDEYVYLHALPETIELSIEGKNILVVHAEPPVVQHGGIKLLDKEGELIPEQVLDWSDKLGKVDCDVLIVGHTHQVFALPLGDLFVVNPGSSQFNHSCMILSLPDMQVDTIALENKKIVKSWNFSHLFGNDENYPGYTL